MGFLKNERGQMAIFVALFFQVIFVFFAMCINVGLVIHDKINLQNAVDLAAYYGATKQAEVLNQMAHINYQMRQNYKLFVWRYRVLGTLGNYNHPLYLHRYWGGGSPPVRNPQQTLYTEGPSWDVNNPRNGVFPSVCVAHSVFKEIKDLDPAAGSLCTTSDFGLPALAQIPGGTGFVPGSNTLPSIRNFLAQQLGRLCKEAGVKNFVFASRILAAFRVDGYVRKQMFWQLRDNLVGSNPLDLRGEPIQEGVRTTFTKNLTDSNANGVQNFTFFNSLESGRCGDGNFWTPEILINPAIMYNDWKADEVNGQCLNAEAKPNRGNANAALPFAFREPLFAQQKAATQPLQEHWLQEPTIQSGYHSSVGFEKNPWCMVYSGVSATTQVRKPFSPGRAITLRARGFAKPFGGRMGPWYGQTWQQGAGYSVSTIRLQLVDPQLPSRNVGGNSAASDPRKDIANYSRFPGDQWGMGSKRALSAMIEPFMTTLRHTRNSDTSPLALANYDNLAGVAALRQSGDPLPRVGITLKAPRNVIPVQRKFELAAVAPDIFDALYYSIEPAYHTNYFTQNPTNQGAQFKSDQVIYDFGSVKDPGDGNTVRGPNTGFSIMDQIANANGSGPNGQTYMRDYEPIIKDWRHVLTSWHQKGAVDYEMDDTKFGQCATEVRNPEYPMTGNCIVGGRTGYSVKSVSMDYLRSADHAIGGDGSGGAILNPPPTDF